MKIHFTLLFVLIISLSVKAQSDAPVPYEKSEVIAVDSSLSAPNLYNTARRWFAETYKDANKVIQLSDSTTHTIVGRASMFYVDGGTSTCGYSDASGHIAYNVEVAAKDGKIRIRMYNLVHTGAVFSGTDWGTIYAGDKCHAMGTLLGMKSLEKRQAAAWDRVRSDCEINVFPQIETEFDGLAASLLKATQQQSKKDDW